jgi:hypothetical protein
VVSRPPHWDRMNGLWRSLVSALDWGSRGPGFKSRQPDEESVGPAQKGTRATANEETTAQKAVCPRVQGLSGVPTLTGFVELGWVPPTAAIGHDVLWHS